MPSPGRFLNPEGRRSFEQITLLGPLGELTAQPGQFATFVAGQPRPLAAVNAGLLHPHSQRLIADPQPAGDLCDRATVSSTIATASALNSEVYRALRHRAATSSFDMNYHLHEVIRAPNSAPAL